MLQRFQHPFCVGSLVVTTLIAGCFFAIFSPGNLSPDSIDIYNQALNNRYHDWHPPIMGVLLSYILHIGGTVDVMIMLQVLSGSLGVFFLTFIVTKNQGLTDKLACITALVVFLLYMVPLFPLQVYLTTLWKDTWVLIILLWIVILSVYFIAPERIINVRDRFLLAALLFLMGFILVIRHNSIVMLPLFMFFLFFLLKIRFKATLGVAVIVSCVPLILWFLITKTLYANYEIKKMHAWTQVVALDLVGMIVVDENLCSSLQFTCDHLEPSYRERYKFGSVGPIIFQKPRIIKAGYLEDRKSLVGEYQQAVVKFPGHLLKVKLRAFRELLDPRRTIHWFWAGIHHLQNKIVKDEEYRLQQNVRWSVARATLIRTLKRVEKHPLLRWVSAVHLLWFACNLLFSGICAIRYLYARSCDILFYFMISLFPLSYYCSYFFATPALDFRFMYPATLVVQLVVITKSVALVVKGATREYPPLTS